MLMQVSDVCRERLRVLIVGAGAVVTEYYIPALRELGWERDALIADPSEESLRQVHAIAPEVALRQVDFRGALAEVGMPGGYEACVVAVPNMLHAAAVRLALEQGLHVLCEKPLALTEATCRELAQLAQQRRRILSVGMVRRLLPSFGMLRQALHQGLIGELDEIEVEDGEPYAWTADSGAAFRPENGGVLADMGVHYLDLMEEVAGEITPVSYLDDSRGGVEANVDYDLRSRSGIPLRLRLSRTRTLRNTFVCRGQHGELVVEKERFDGCSWRAKDTGCVTWLQPRTERAATLQTCFARQLAELAIAVRQEKQPPVSAERTASTIGLIEWAYRHRARKPLATQVPGERSIPSGGVCITGATGFIGTHLLERLGETGKHTLVAPVRSYRTCAEIARYPVAMPRINLLDYQSVRDALSGSRFVFHLAYGRDGSQRERVTIEGTRNVVDAAVAAGCEAVVVLSTIYVFGQPDARVDEAWPYRPVGGVYGTSKALMERWCLKRAQSSGRTRIVVLIPSCVYGAGGDAYAALPARLAREGGFCWISDGRGTANYTYVENLVDAMLLGATSAEAHGRRFIINDGTVTWRRFLGELLGASSERMPSYAPRQLHELHEHRRRPTLVDVARVAMADAGVRATLRETRLGEAALWSAEHATPRVMARMRMGWHGQSERTEPPVAYRGGPAGAAARGGGLPPAWLADLYGPAQTVFRSETARLVLGWAPRVSLEDGLTATRAWVEANL
jgi:nucleoside-diphosphate-sugar epimerase/predicted dehydrogenase